MTLAGLRLCLPRRHGGMSSGKQLRRQARHRLLQACMRVLFL